MMRFILALAISSMAMHSMYAQDYRWQQEVKYDMYIDFDVKTHRFDGEQQIIYTNNSNDTLKKVYYHLYFNAFQPGSMMDVRSRTIVDPDRRVGSRIVQLSDEEIGFHRISSFKQNGKDCSYEVVGTILEVELADAILPGSKSTFDMVFKSQVPIQIRRSGRDNSEGISYSMAQWYPKLCEYDYQGWHANPYVGREFHGVWGDFTVVIDIDRKYTVGAGGVLQNAEKMGHGYSDKNTKKRKFLGKKNLRWEFVAENVHDFVWSADPDYTHLVFDTDQGTELHYFFDEGSADVDNWLMLHKAMNVAEKFMNERYGVYPYPIYAFLQGGDGGMEYPMATLITGNRRYSSLVGVSIHEWMHSWYQMVLGTNESLYSWMDEGFTSFASREVMNHLKEKGIISGKVEENPHRASLRGYSRFAKSGYEEPLSTHADHFSTNQAYSVAAYTKGSVFIAQLEYILGKEVFAKAIKRYFNEWKFRHPNPNDFIRVFERESGLELDWYKEYMVNTTHTIDYGIDTLVSKENGNVEISLSKIGKMPMPLEIRVELNNGSIKDYYIPLRIMRGEKSFGSKSVTQLEDWPWTHPSYSFEINVDLESIKSVRIDPDEGMADGDLENNVWEQIIE